MPEISQRVIAVEEHFATARYWEQTANLQASPGEDAERVYSRSFIANEFISRRLTDLQTRLVRDGQGGRRRLGSQPEPTGRGPAVVRRRDGDPR